MKKNNSSSRPLSLNKRILTSIIIMFTLGFSTLGIYSLDSSKQLRRALAHVEAKAMVRHFSPGDDINSLPQQYDKQEVSYTLYSPNGKVLAMSSNLQSPRRLRDIVIHKTRWLPNFSSVGYVINVPVHYTDGHVLMVARNDAYNREMVDDVLFAGLQSSIAILLSLLLLFSSIVWFLLRWTLKPVTEAATAASSITPGTSEQIPTQELPHEIQPLAEAANTAMNRLAQAYQAEQRFVADAAHELRTPLAVLKLRLQQNEGKENSNSELLKSDVQKIQRLVEQLLQLARLDGELQSQNSQQQLFDCARLARTVVADHIPLYENKQRQLNLTIHDDRLPLMGQPALFAIALANLVENALSHGQGKVEIALQSTANEVLISVRDEGPALPSSTRSNLFQRFKKQYENSPGSGLGLSIVRQIVEQMHGQVDFMDVAYCCIELRLPHPNTAVKKTS
ncbi:MAG: HAMP domain-containing histidine kinase [Cellvibrionaceae bacterium]|nr:HAMP domain-containing histidine kinase [Cellvibrionaceae bacterium]